MRRRVLHKSCLAALIAMSFAAQPALARDEEGPALPPLYQKLIDCRAVSDQAARLECYDRQTSALDEATRKREIVISDRNNLKAARRGLFGFAAPIGRLMGFGGDDNDAEQIKEVESKVAGVRHASAGWRLDLEDGSTWEQNDTRDFVLSPKIGNSAKISRGVLGTYFVSVEGQRAIKMRRVK